MTKPGIIYGQKLSGLFVLLLSLLLTLLLPGCDDENRSGSSENISVSGTEAASTALTINWHETADEQDSAVIRAASLDCEAGGVENIICTVYDASGNLLVTGEPWPCTARSGTIEGIPAGQDRTFVVLAEDADGDVRYHGETSGVTINAGENQSVVVDTYLFISNLATPDESDQIDINTFSLEWEIVQNADEYLLQVAEDIDFQSIIIEEITPATFYVPTGLAASTQYFWRISAVDPYTNVGAESEVRSFTTSDCAHTISPESSPFTQSGGTGSVSVSGASECTWSASTDAQWIQITSGTSGTGDGTVSYTVSANTGAARSAQITIAGQTHTVSQDAADCIYTISPASQTIAAAGSTYDVTVTATQDGCDWTASENSSWISLSPTSGTGGATVSITVAANTGAARSAQITIAGQTHTVDQDPATCTYTITPTSQTVAAAGSAYDVTITATHSGCGWTASENSVSWISLSPASGSGNGTVSVTVAANTGQERSAQITIAGQTHTVSQDAAACSFAISSTSQTVDADGSAYDVTVTATHGGCGWTASESSSWISLSPSSGSGGAAVSVTVAANTGQERSAQITIAGQTHTVTQQAAACAYAISPTSQTVDADGSTYDVTVTATHGGCGWTASESSSWISLSPSSGSGDGTVSVTVSANTSAARQTQITIAGQTHTVGQASGRPDLLITSGTPAVSSSNVYRGGNVTLSSWTVSNQGASASGTFTNGYYLSENATISTADTRLTDNINSSLSSGASFTWGAVTLVIPTSISPGTYYIGILVDRTNAVTESNEGNNDVSRQITVY
ncbi:MAG: BACON domain-containing carbohydrate-binding protein [Desulfobacteraceae bacterium]